MKKYTAHFHTADDCDFALSELKSQMTLHRSHITYIYGGSSGDLPVNYPDTPIADYSSEDYLPGKEHILRGSNVNYDYNEYAEKQSVKLKFYISDKNSSQAGKTLLKHKAYNIKCGE